MPARKFILLWSHGRGFINTRYTVSRHGGSVNITTASTRSSDPVATILLLGLKSRPLRPVKGTHRDGTVMGVTCHGALWMLQRATTQDQCRKGEKDNCHQQTSTEFACFARLRERVGRGIKFLLIVYKHSTSPNNGIYHELWHSAKT